MSEHEPHYERLTDGADDETLINREVEVAEKEDRIISNAAARMIAAAIHGGQYSAAYKLVSNGYIDEENLPGELKRTYYEEGTTDQTRTWIDALERYIAVREDKWFIPGWEKLWLKDEPAAPPADIEWHQDFPKAEGES